jgi:hypothetical protein
MVSETEKVVSEAVAIGYEERAKFLQFPWPWESGSIKELNIVDVLQYCPAKDRIHFMEEVYRVLTDDGKAAITVPYFSTVNAIMDPTTEWPPWCEQSFLYFNKEWRRSNKISDSIHCDLDFGYGFNVPPEVSARSAEAQAFQIKNYINTVTRLTVVLTKRKTS